MKGFNEFEEIEELSNEDDAKESTGKYDKILSQSMDKKKKLRKRKSTLKRSITVEQITKIMSKVQRKAESGGKKSSNNVSIGIKLALREITKELKKKSSSSVNNTDNPDLEIKKKMQSE